MSASPTAPPRSAPPATIAVILSFAAIYIIWGSTYLAIRIAVETVPPFLAAGIRFLLAGMILFGYVWLKKTPWPTAPEWRNLAVTAAILFVPSYGGLFYAEQSVPSGIAAGMVATIPVWIAIFEVLVLKQTRLHWQLIASVCLGFGGVALLSIRGLQLGGHSLWPYLVMMFSQITWSVGTLLSKNLKLPESKPLVSAAQMTIGGFLLLCLSAGVGELSHAVVWTMDAALAILYLTTFGSVVAFTAYLYLLSHMPATTVGSYAFVNPVIALALGAWLGHEALDWRVYVGTAMILTGVVLILRGSRAH